MIDNDDKWRLRFLWNIRAIIVYIRNGFCGLLHADKGLFAFVIYCIALIGIWVIRFEIWHPQLKHNELEKAGISVKLFLGMLIVTAVVLFLIGKPKDAKRMCDNFHRMGLVNHAGEAPLLLSHKAEKNIIILEFESFGIALPEWEDKLEKIESALNIRIDLITEGTNSRRVLIYCVSGNRQFPSLLIWNDKFMSSKGFELVLGESFIGQVRWDLQKVPHLLIGGSTGSGKSILMKLLLMQCIKKGATVYISDFKGGVDFSRLWHEKTSFLTDEDSLVKALSNVVDELNRRKVLLHESGRANIDEYNLYRNEKLQRIIFAFDEVAEILAGGNTKGQKEVKAKVESYLSVIARQGRAFGINLILSTQRPDATIISGQIKSNIDYRVCGRADDVLSQIILDKTDAADRISKNAQGRFLNHDGILFQSYFFDDKKEW